MKRRVILLGPPGSGKGTVAAHLQTALGFIHLSSGQLLRDEVEHNTAVGRAMARFLEKGELVPDNIVLDLVTPKLQPAVLQNGFLLDGFPRTIPQAQALDQFLQPKAAPIQAVLLCHCTEPIIIDRMSGRRICPTCGRSYHVRNVPPRIPGRCDGCGSTLVQREDDTEPVVRKRLNVYQQQTAPLVALYQAQAKLTVLDATGPTEALRRAAVLTLSE